jgi:CAAX protease family protein
VRSGRTWLSITVIVAFWAFAIVRFLHESDVGWAPASVRELALGSAAMAVLTALLVTLLLEPGEGFAGLGLDREALRAGWKRGLVAGAVLFVLVNLALTPTLEALGLHGRADVMASLFADPRDAGWWLLAVVVGGGFREELTRAFVLTRFERAAGVPGLLIALLVHTAVFGLGHAYQGSRGVVGSGFTGLLFALMYLRRRNLGEVMVAHVAFDVLGVTAGYLLAARPG